MLALVPAGFLVLILLAGIAVDSAVAYQAQAQLHDALAAAANDAVAAGVDDPAFYQQGQVELNPAAVAAAVCGAVRAQGLTSLHRLRVEVATSGVSVRVTGTAAVDAVFSRALPGFGPRSVSSTASAVLAAGPGGEAATTFGPAPPLSCS